MVVGPVNVFAAESVHVPAFCLVRVPVVVPIILAIVPSFAPPSVKPKVAPVIVPVLDNVISPVVEMILLAAPIVINPAYVAAVALLLLIAPPLDIPVPLMVNASEDEYVIPFKSRAAPDDTVVPAAVVPKAALLLSFKIPSLTVVVPV